MTELDPVTFPTAESAYFSPTAAYMLANVSGSDVPKATKVMAVIGYSIPKTHPNKSANSPTMKVTAPIKTREITKQAHPPIKCGGGMKEKINFHPIKMKWKTPSMASIS